MKYPELNLPSIDLRIEMRAGEEYVFDAVRKKFLLHTPEEWVRQHFVGLLINHLHYPKGLIQLERQHNYHSKLKRTDILVMNSEGQPFLLVECKSFTESLSQKTLDQIAVYNKSLNSAFIAVSNGIKHFVWRRSSDGYEQLKDFPAYGD